MMKHFFYCVLTNNITLSVLAGKAGSVIFHAFVVLTFFKTNFLKKIF